MVPLPHTLVVEHFPQLGAEGEIGISGILILVESHIAIHTWPERNYARVEISSCREFDPSVAVSVIKHFFGGTCTWECHRW